MFCWYAREQWGIQFSLVTCGDCLEVCFVRLVVGSNYVWCLVKVVIFVGFEKAGAKRCGGCSKVISWGWRCKSKKGTVFIGKTGSHYVILLYYETLLQVLLGIYCKRFYQIHLFTILLLLYVFEVGKAKSTTQIILMILTLNGLFQKKIQAFYFTLGKSREIKLHTQKLCIYNCVVPFINFKA